MRTELTFAIVTTLLTLFAILLGCSKSFVIEQPRGEADTTETYTPRRQPSVGHTWEEITFSVEVEGWWETPHDTIHVYN